MLLYHLTKVKVIKKILTEGLIAFRCYEYESLLPNKYQPVVWFTDNIREKGSYLHPSRCLVYVDSNRLDKGKLKKISPKGWWVYEGNIPSKYVELVNWTIYRRIKPKFWEVMRLE